MTFTGFAVWTIACAAIAGFFGLAGATVMSVRRPDPEPDLWWRWFRLYSLVGIALYVLYFAIKFTLWLGAQFNAHAYGNMVIALLVIAMGAAVIVVARRQLRERLGNAPHKETSLGERLQAIGLVPITCPRVAEHRMAVPPSSGLWCPACADEGVSVWCTVEPQAAVDQ